MRNLKTCWENENVGSEYFCCCYFHQRFLKYVLLLISLVKSSLGADIFIRDYSQFSPNDKHYRSNTSVILYHNLNIWLICCTIWVYIINQVCTENHRLDTLKRFICLHQLRSRHVVLTVRCTLTQQYNTLQNINAKDLIWHKVSNQCHCLNEGTSRILRKKATRSHTHQ